MYVAENMADSVAVVDMATHTVVQRVSTGHYPYAFVVSPTGYLFVSSWGATSVDGFLPMPDGRLVFESLVHAMVAAR